MDHTGCLFRNAELRLFYKCLSLIQFSLVPLSQIALSWFKFEMELETKAGKDPGAAGKEDH